MNPGQEMFLNFMLERVQEGKVDELKQILLGSFEAQKTTPLTKESFETLSAQLLALVKPEAISEIQGAMAHFAQNIK